MIAEIFKLAQEFIVCHIRWDFLNAQSDYRVVQLAYVQLVGSYLTYAGQLNLVVGHEEIE